MICYVLNLERSKNRLDKFMDSFGQTQLEIERLVAVEGRELSEINPDISLWRYRIFHGQRFSGTVFGCAMSHLNALKTFLATEETHAMICEDDVVATPDLDTVLTECMRHRKSWDLLRLNALRHCFRSFPFAKLDKTYSLCRIFGWFPGAGAYIVNRHAAVTLLRKAYPIYLPYDHFLARSHLFGLKTTVVEPLPILLGPVANQSTIEFNHSLKYHPLTRWPTTLPYRGIIEGRKNLHQYLEIAIAKLCPPKPED